MGQHMVPFMVENGHDVLHSYYSTQPNTNLGGKAVQLDMRDSGRVAELIQGFNPDTIIHLAASNRSSSESAMVASIEEGASNIVSAAQEIGCRLIHMSTDVVFDGTNSPYSETDPVSPIHAYGRAKANAEKIVSAYANSVIVRPSLIYSLRIKDRSIEWMEAALKRGEEITLFTDQIRNPVSTDTLCHACHELSEHDFRGVLHVVGQEDISRAAFGEMMLDWWGIERSNLVKMAKMPEDAPWPLDLRLKVDLAQKTLQTPLYGVKEVFSKLS